MYEKAVALKQPFTINLKQRENDNRDDILSHLILAVTKVSITKNAELWFPRSLIFTFTGTQKKYLYQQNTKILNCDVEIISHRHKDKLFMQQTKKSLLPT
ncbi:hypothetical protein GOODEAATRI_018312 [Goodea atripinnis]|uniref:Uncharacterized protein n=1 Tax=Goodea atripinnis TaxID=208336 RepID=A0ABV0MIV0_9TELE